MDGWIKKGWRLSDGQAVKNKEDFLELLKAAEGLRVKWVSVRETEEAAVYFAFVPALLVRGDDRVGRRKR